MTAVDPRLLCPFELTVEPIARFLNAELADHPVYDGIELQWFDNASHGTGMLAFLSRRSDRRVDYDVDPGLDLDRSGYQIGGGTGAWVPTEFAVARLEVDANGVVAEVGFTDVDGRSIDLSVDDRHQGRGEAPARRPARPRRRWHRGAELADDGPSARVRPGSTGGSPSADPHRRTARGHGRTARRVAAPEASDQAAAPLSVAALCRARVGPLAPVGPAAPGDIVLDQAGAAIAGIETRRDDAEAALTLDPPLPPLARLREDEAVSGSWRVAIDGASITGGTWRAVRRGRSVDLALDVTRPWEPPPGHPLLMRVVTRAVPVFRRWPTTYRWAATVDLGEHQARMSSRWERTDDDRGQAYRRATGSAPR